MDCSLQGCLLLLQNHLCQLLLDHTAGYSTCGAENHGWAARDRGVAPLAHCVPCPHAQYRVSQALFRQDPGPRPGHPPDIPRQGPASRGRPRLAVASPAQPSQAHQQGVSILTSLALVLIEKLP